MENVLNNLLTNLEIQSRKRELEQTEPVIIKIRSFETSFKELDENELRDKTTEFKNRLKDGQTLDEILPEAFAVVCEASRRTLGLEPHDEQLMAGIFLHQGKIAEMKTGEGKTLAASLALYLNALSGEGVHLVTTNDYLAQRDALWMQPIYNSLGLTVGVIHQNIKLDEKQAAYNADITYGSKDQFAFDYLHDHGVTMIENKSQRGHKFAIVDEADSVLIDEAITDFIISGLQEPNSVDIQILKKASQAVEQLELEELEINEKDRTIVLNKKGITHLSNLLEVKIVNEARPEEITEDEAIILTVVEQALKAKFLFIKDIDYVVKHDQIVIIDKFTGREVPSRRWSDGLHQAIEAKEQVKINPESINFATISAQNYFRRYDKLAGTTATALSDQQEFMEVYKLQVVSIPEHHENQRIDKQDIIYTTEEMKMQAVVVDILRNHLKGRPVLIGTKSIIDSESLAEMLEASSLNEMFEELMKLRGHKFKVSNYDSITTLLKLLELNEEDREKLIDIFNNGIKCNVLNANNHSIEGRIIAGAGAYGAVTIATNMAGRGVDIKLGGQIPETVLTSIRKILEINNVPDVSKLNLSEQRDKIKFLFPNEYGIYKDDIECFIRHVDEMEKVKNIGGLYVIGTQRHDSRRIDNQLIGRAARQGDPGSSRFYLSLEDDLLSKYGEDQRQWILSKLPNSYYPIPHSLIGQIVTESQLEAERTNRETRMHSLRLDDALNGQREDIYRRRDQILLKPNLEEDVRSIIQEQIDLHIEEFNKSGEIAPLLRWVHQIQPGIRMDNSVLLPSLVQEILLKQINTYNKEDRNIQTVFADLIQQAYDFNPNRKDIRVMKKIKELVKIKITELTKDGKEVSMENKLLILNHITDNLDCSYLAGHIYTDGKSAKQISKNKEMLKNVKKSVQDHLEKATQTQINIWGERIMKSKSINYPSQPTDTAETVGKKVLYEGTYRQMLLKSITIEWINYLSEITHLRVGINLEAYGQKDPMVQFKRISPELYSKTIERIKARFVNTVFRKTPII